jgi:hypothetical protein
MKQMCHSRFQLVRVFDDGECESVEFYSRRQAAFDAARYRLGDGCRYFVYDLMARDRQANAFEIFARGFKHLSDRVVLRTEAA